jgi:hypothetical protein
VNDAARSRAAARTSSAGGEPEGLTGRRQVRPRRGAAPIGREIRRLPVPQERRWPRLASRLPSSPAGWPGRDGDQLSPDGRRGGSGVKGRASAPATRVSGEPFAVSRQRPHSTGVAAAIRSSSLCRLVCPASMPIRQPSFSTQCRLGRIAAKDGLTPAGRYVFA